MILSHDNVPSTNTTCGAVDLNLYEVGAVASGAVLCLNGIAVVASLAPAYATVMGGAAAGLGYVGYRKRNDLPLNPFTKSEEDSFTDAPAEAVA